MTAETVHSRAVAKEKRRRKKGTKPCDARQGPGPLGQKEKGENKKRIKERETVAVVPSMPLAAPASFSCKIGIWLCRKKEWRKVKPNGKSSVLERDAVSKAHNHRFSAL